MEELAKWGGYQENEQVHRQEVAATLVLDARMVTCRRDVM